MTLHPLRMVFAGVALCLATATPLFAQDIDFGDDTSQWAKDGECDDPRFTGSGAADELVDEDRMHDATDCRAAFEAGTVTLAEEKAPPKPAPDTPAPPAAPEPAPVAPSTSSTAPEIDFGDDSSQWAKDGECDDPRFTGTGAATELLDEDRLHDATDCRAAFEAGTVTLSEGSGGGTGDIDFGDDASQWAKDGECDDPRFTGTGAADELVETDRLHDATDCRAAYEAGTVTLADETAPGSTSADTAALTAMAGRIDFGDDTSEWAKDGECDDPDFFGPDVAEEPSAENRMKDATDCRAAFIAGTASFGKASSTATQPAAFDYGNDSSRWANDGQCDDLRFVGPGMAKKLDYEDVMADATDCRTLEEQNDISIREVYTPQYAAGAPYDSSGVDFGDNASAYADNGECDDPRFEGPGAAVTLLDSDRAADANDCKAQFEAGRIVLRDGES
ncbi:hypothetical protein IC608_14290 [Devosia sp. PTR5]|uniref:Uncharacterized protein n=1 Tax=Devosia oryzisoli TaxID=2774138 RepID=A0A927FUP2_9HYPH|nr:hypothetical protein [Devosia oryzisoli]MBD8066640.1 hypothetical protein [Devosia oryzisoli]